MALRYAPARRLASTPWSPSRAHQNRVRARFTKEDFRYESEQDQYRCPAGEALTWRYETMENGRKIHAYFSSACKRCAIRAKCTATDLRRIRRWEHEAVVDAMLAKLEEDPGKMRLRSQTVEHPFGTLKFWMGATHFLTRTLERVRTEMSLNVLAYNMKRVINLLGITPLMQAIRA